LGISRSFCRITFKLVSSIAFVDEFEDDDGTMLTTSHMLELVGTALSVTLESVQPGRWFAKMLASVEFKRF